MSCYDDEVGAFSLPPKQFIMKRRVVVATCLMAAKVGLREVGGGGEGEHHESHQVTPSHTKSH